MALAVVAALVIGVVGCGSGEQGTDVRKIAFVAPFGDNEADWTLQAKEILADWPEKLRVRVDTADASQTDDVRGVLEQVSHEGNQLVIAHDSRYADDAEAVAKETKVPELVWGERSESSDGLVGQITVQDKEGGYMAGIIAARSAITKRLGIIVVNDGSDWDLQTWNRTAGGFVAGALSVDPTEVIRYAEVGEGQATRDQVHDAAMRLLKSGSQMIFALGGASTVGALRAVEERRGENQYISVVGDKATFNRENYVLASVMWDVRPAFTKALHDLRAGTFADHPYELTLKNRGIWLLSTGRTPLDAAEAAGVAQRQIDSGRLRVPTAATEEAVQALIEGEEPQG